MNFNLLFEASVAIQADEFFFYIFYWFLFLPVPFIQNKSRNSDQQKNHEGISDIGKNQE